MKVQQSRLVQEVLANREAAERLREAMRSSQEDHKPHEFTFTNDKGQEKTVTVSSIPKPA